MSKNLICKHCKKVFFDAHHPNKRYCTKECFNIVQRKFLTKLNKSLKFRKQNSGKNHHHWKGGRVITVRGYIWIRRPNHPDALSTGYIYEHRLVAEKKLG